MSADPGVIGPAMLGMTQSISLFQTMLPKFTEIRQTNPDDNPAMVQDVRMGEFAAVLLTIGIGAMTSALTGSAVPSVVAVTSAAGLVMLYESALRARTEVNANA